MNDILNSIAHRGPDDNLTASLESCNGVLGHRRLRILDIHPRSNQPFWSPDKRFVLVFNGEIYNYKLLRKQLEADGIRFVTSSDTEVLLYWLIKNGTEGLSKLDGMFAFAFLDLKYGKLICARDPFGEKPFYYTFDRGKFNFAFCSEIKGLLKLPYVDKTINENGLADYLRFLYTAPPHTFYKGIKELEPGHFMHLDLASFDLRINKFFDIEEQTGEIGSQPYEVFRSLLLESVKRRLQSDVPVCIYLSGGMDSNAIMACAKEAEPEEKFLAFTISYRRSLLADQVDESALAQKSSQFFGASLKVIDFATEMHFLKAINKMVDIFDQPFGNSTAIVSEMLACAVSKDFRVALVGDGGDEVAAGYPRHKALLTHRNITFLPLSFRVLLSKVLLQLPVRGKHQPFMRRLHQFAKGVRMKPAEAFLNWSTYLDEEEVAFALGKRQISRFKEELLTLFERNQQSLLRAASLVDLKSFVPFNLMQCADRTSMIHSLELRTPFLSKELVQYSLSVDENIRFNKGELKPLIRRGLSDLLPSFILKQPKRAFNPPIFEWVKNNITFLEKYLMGNDAKLRTLISPSFVTNQLNLFRFAKRDNATFLWGLAVLECWLRRT